MKIRIKLQDGKIIKRKVKFTVLGNFVIASVRYNHQDFLLNEWDGDEYLRGVNEDKIYTIKV